MERLNLGCCRSGGDGGVEGGGGGIYDWERGGDRGGWGWEISRDGDGV